MKGKDDVHYFVLSYFANACCRAARRRSSVRRSDVFSNSVGVDIAHKVGKGIATVSFGDEWRLIPVEALSSSKRGIRIARVDSQILIINS